MFEPSPKPRLFALPPGVDFGSEIVKGMIERSGRSDPIAMARTRVIVNTRRLQRRLRECFDDASIGLQPQILTLSDIAADPLVPIPLSGSRTGRRLDLMRLVNAVIDANPDIAPQSAAYDVATSLADLFEEIHGEGVDPGILDQLDVSDASGHWDLSLRFLRLVRYYFDQTEGAVDQEGRLRRVTDHLAQDWGAAPPIDPVLMVGSTGSRGGSLALMRLVSRLPQGAVVLPGFDFGCPRDVWETLRRGPRAEDHPQYRFARLMTELELSPSEILPWTSTGAASSSRNALISLSLRPAPVTDQWQTEAPHLKDLDGALEGVTLLEAQTVREEAEAIALRLRMAVEEGKTAALVTPDRGLTRQVAAVLDRWDIAPDDSAGTPLAQTPPGRLFRHVLQAMVGQLDAETLLTLLKHPLAAAGSADRGMHLLFSRTLELRIRSKGIPYPGAEDLQDWVETQGDDAMLWAGWVSDIIQDCQATFDVGTVADWVDRHVRLTERVCAGPNSGDPSVLWAESAGRSAKAWTEDLARLDDAGGTFDIVTYAEVFPRLLSGVQVRNRDAGHPQVLFWGTLEARVQASDIVILGSMNEGVWPEAPAPDPWLNRDLRAKSGLLLPERRIGLSAHDYQQAVAAAEVWITRSVRSDDAQTVPSRWINRLTGLLGGIKDGVHLSEIRAKGALWLAEVRRRNAVVSGPSAPRPLPIPPVAARPNKINVTEIEKLVRDPYAIYAKRILKLRKLGPLVREPDALLRGTIVHEVLETFLRQGTDPTQPGARAALLTTAEQVLSRECPWPAARQMWLGQIDRIADWFLQSEAARQTRGTPKHFELEAELAVGTTGVSIRGRPDRIDISDTGDALAYDYKTGKPPTAAQQEQFDPQLLVLSAMIERGAFADVRTRRVTVAEYISVSSSPSIVAAPIDTESPQKVWNDLSDLLTKWRDADKGYAARSRPELTTYDSDYDHLSRYGEWGDSDPFVRILLS